MAVRSRASTATASPRRRSCPRCSARILSAPSASSGDLGPRQRDEPAQGDRPLLAGREPPARAALSPAPARDPLPLPRRQRKLLLRDRAVRGHRRMPQGAEWHHVPQLHGDQGGDALHPRPTPALRDVPGRPDEEGWKSDGFARHSTSAWLARDAGPMPDERGHGHLQGRVPLALLRAAVAAPARLRDGLDRLVGAARVDRSRSGEPVSHLPLVGAAFESLGGISSRRQMPLFATETFKAWFRAGRRADRLAPRLALARHVQQPFPPADGHRGRRGAGGARASRSSCRGGRSAAAARSTTSACSSRPRSCCGRSSTRSGPRSRGELRSWGSSRAAWRSSATS